MKVAIIIVIAVAVVWIAWRIDRRCEREIERVTDWRGWL